MVDGHPAPRLVVLQPSSLCNLNCTYCYVPGRQDSSLMSEEVISAAARFIFSCNFPNGEVEFLWHAGEPLAVGLPFYERAFSIIEDSAVGGLTLSHVMQTNGTLVDRDWCAFFRKHRIFVGLSVDGPALLHDKNRPTWGGRGTHAKVMRAFDLLREAGMSPTAICVLTNESLSSPDAIYDFFVTSGFKSVGFNIEESEGTHKSSLLMPNDKSVRDSYAEFLKRIYERWRADGYALRIREFNHLLNCVRCIQRDDDFVREPDEVVPFGILTIRRDGGISTYSPELASTKSIQYNDFLIGNVLNDSPLDVIRGNSFSRLQAEVAYGQSRCREGCTYYALCGGGFQSNRFTEHGSVRAMETLTCRLHRQTLIDVFVDQLHIDSMQRR
jgi:uncharacterized protein